MLEIVLATTNPGKVAEIEEIMSGLPVRFLTRQDLSNWPGPIDETGKSYLENALIKARAFSQTTGKAALADDSGIEVDALDGAPGIRSARFSGPGATDAQNNSALAELMREVPVDSRTARYRCVAVVLTPDGTEITAEGTCEGTIAMEPAGTGGFGYDPWFIPEGYEQTFGELSAEVKHAISHRGKALRQLSEKLEGAGLVAGNHQ
jgi:non-canonical purine NTP pyrophosphatase (RdgB/HAM1 family)